MNESTPGMGQVIKIDEARIQDHLGQVVRSTVEETLNGLQHAMRVIGDWIQFYNHRRPHQALGMKTPAEAYALAA